MSFELELLRLDRDGKATVIDRELCPLELSLAKMKAQQIFDEKQKDGDGVDAIRILSSSGEEVFLYRNGAG